MYAIQNRRGFSLIELVIVIVIIGIIGAIAIPRMSRGAAGAADSALAANLAVLRNAIELYHMEHHNTYPTAAQFEAQLLSYTNDEGTVNPTDPNQRTNEYAFGPYLRAIPPLPVGPLPTRGSTTIATGGTPGSDPAAGGWWYNPQTGEIRANLPDSETDTRGRPFNQY